MSSRSAAGCSGSEAPARSVNTPTFDALFGERFSDTWPLVGKKMDLLEGGIRVPYIVRWPARIKPGCVTAQFALTMDWTATFFAAAGVKAHAEYPLDGESLVRTLENPGATFERELFWRMKYRNQKAMRSGDWKYLSVEGDEFLFNLAADERERANFAMREPGRLAELRTRYAEWEKTLPLFPKRRSRCRRRRRTSLPLELGRAQPRNV